ncbi:predicted protein [Plenodomus lingam JN3]|uniref:Predicted protein n=1 Tax=Leptosphaeria maculans (strain JN3 / isolate v23.1.3 / race Av1-4-5-6-7-8) TaxID=985895 RepID=E4ZY61_LEPMJ|nr:predicted protein [Plenodomus lingam JN3]CBX96306.1 predicted protein [Plenodomus lingam JN3]
MRFLLLTSVAVVRITYTDGFRGKGLAAMRAGRSALVHSRPTQVRGKCERAIPLEPPTSFISCFLPTIRSPSSTRHLRSHYSVILQPTHAASRRSSA